MDTKIKYIDVTVKFYPLKASERKKSVKIPTNLSWGMAVGRETNTTDA